MIWKERVLIGGKATELAESVRFSERRWKRVHSDFIPELADAFAEYAKENGNTHLEYKIEQVGKGIGGFIGRLTKPVSHARKTDVRKTWKIGIVFKTALDYLVCLFDFNEENGESAVEAVITRHQNPIIGNIESSNKGNVERIIRTLMKKLNAYNEGP